MNEQLAKLKEYDLKTLKREEKEFNFTDIGSLLDRSFDILDTLTSKDLQDLIPEAKKQEILLSHLFPGTRRLSKAHQGYDLSSRSWRWLHGTGVKT